MHEALKQNRNKTKQNKVSP